MLGIALALRLGWGLSRGWDDASVDPGLPDQAEYLALGRNLLEGRGLQFFDPRFDDTVQAYRSPGYPTLVALCGANVPAIRIAQALLDTSTVLAAYLLALALLRADAASRTGPLIAAALVAVNPFLVYFSALILSETLFTAMLAWGIVLLVAGGRGARLRWVDHRGEATAVRPWRGTFMWLAGGLVLAAAALVRPSAAPLPVLLGLAAAFVNRPPGRAYSSGQSAVGSGQEGLAPPSSTDCPLRWPLPTGMTMLLISVAVLFPWAARNARTLGQWVWTTTNDGITLYDGLNPDAAGGSDQSFVRRMPQLRYMGEVERSQYLADLAMQYARTHPGRVAWLGLVKAGRTWSPIPLSDAYGSRAHVLAGLVFAPVYLMALVGVLRGNMGRSAKVLLLLPAIYLTLVHALTVGSLRYRVPVEPLVAVLAASLFARERARWMRAGGARAAAGGGGAGSQSFRTFADPGD